MRVPPRVAGPRLRHQGSTATRRRDDPLPGHVRSSSAGIRPSAEPSRSSTPPGTTVPSRRVRKHRRRADPQPIRPAPSTPRTAIVVGRTSRSSFDLIHRSRRILRHARRAEIRRRMRSKTTSPTLRLLTPEPIEPWPTVLGARLAIAPVPAEIPQAPVPDVPTICKDAFPLESRRALHETPPPFETPASPSLALPGRRPSSPGRTTANDAQHRSRPDHPRPTTGWC